MESGREHLLQHCSEGRRYELFLVWRIKVVLKKSVIKPKGLSKQLWNVTRTVDEVIGSTV